MFAAVDIFVILDDVNYIKRGYINSNSILINGNAHRFTISLDKSSQNKFICDTRLFFPASERAELLKKIYIAYKKAPMFESVYSLLEKTVLFDTSDLTSFIENSIYKTKEYLSINTEIIKSSEIKKNNSLKGEERIIEINKILGADVYINAIGGQKLYNYDNFKRENIELRFIKSLSCEYKQFGNKFIPNLSFIDVLMFNSKESVLELLKDYTLIVPSVN